MGKAPTKCPMCGEATKWKLVDATNKKFSIGKAFVGAALIGTVDKTLPFKERQFISTFCHVESYEDLLDALVSEQDRSFCNSRHIIDKFAEKDFYSTDHFLTQQDKYEFTYIKLENDI